MEIYWLWVIGNGLFGLIIGSFLNVVVLRRNTGKSLAGRSGCLSCGKTLAWYELVPVVSWVTQHGRCRGCESRISAQYPLVETSLALSFGILAAALVPLPMHLLGLVLLSFYAAIVAYDMNHTIIPDSWSYSAAVVAFLLSIAAMPLELVTIPVLVSVLVAGAVIALPLHLLWYFSKGKAMGLGDAKLALSIGFLLGILDGVQALMIAFVIGAVVSVLVVMVVPRVRLWLAMHGITRLGAPLAPGTMDYEVPFGPFLVIGALIVWFANLFAMALPHLLFPL